MSDIPDLPKFKVKETLSLKKWEGDRLIEEITVVDGVVSEKIVYDDNQSYEE